MPHRPVAIVGAMAMEFAPLLAKVRAQQVGGVDLFLLEQAVIAIGGIGEEHAHRAAEEVAAYSRPALLVSAGLAGAVSPKLNVGDVGRVLEVVDVTTGERYPTRGGEWVLATSQDVIGQAGKQNLLAKYGADVVDMEAAAVAQVARERGLEFAAVKSISDDAAFDVPPLGRFIDKNGRFSSVRFLAYVAFRPEWWPVVKKMRANSKIAVANLGYALQHLIMEYAEAHREEGVSQL